jgi:hypothetical protein
MAIHYYTTPYHIYVLAHACMSFTSSPYSHTGIFVYQSCTQELPGGFGTMGGDITMVPGSIDQPEGEHFLLPVPPFPLAQPDFIF